MPEVLRQLPSQSLDYMKVISYSLAGKNGVATFIKRLNSLSGVELRLNRLINQEEIKSWHGLEQLDVLC
jgi:hypothetical protein